MRKDYQEKLLSEYPIILQNMNKGPKYSGLGFGIECDDGWYPLLNKLLRFLQWHKDKNNYPQVIATQIKEKYGALRFYFNYDSDSFESSNKNTAYLEGAIGFAESMSSTICEVCGNPGKIERVAGWYSCKCQVCRDK